MFFREIDKGPSFFIFFLQAQFTGMQNIYITDYKYNTKGVYDLTETKY